MQLAAASGIGWDQAYFPMNKHLWDLVEYSHRKHGVLFSAIVVNSDNLGSGKMDPPTLRGFIGAARDLGYPVTDERAFLREQQTRVFAWAQKEASAVAS